MTFSKIFKSKPIFYVIKTRSFSLLMLDPIWIRQEVARPDVLNNSNYAIIRLNRKIIIVIINKTLIISIKNNIQHPNIISHVMLSSALKTHKNKLRLLLAACFLAVWPRPLVVIMGNGSNQLKLNQRQSPKHIRVGVLKSPNTFSISIFPKLTRSFIKSVHKETGRVSPQSSLYFNLFSLWRENRNGWPDIYFVHNDYWLLEYIAFWLTSLLTLLKS